MRPLIIIDLIATTDIATIARRGVAVRLRTSHIGDQEKKRRMIEISGGVIQIGFPRRGIVRSGDVERSREEKTGRWGKARVAAISATYWIA